ncbi:hypothetical protein PVAND_004397 [Polypedilum vanderplanki]|uniref:Uncharacterized protein n=1 Tax=Polypedilum vanderplanki TaxID=319348 RepID=A0A9J6BWV3_POLVA|nr:hypothetical protein PVAND_004397 [Polypedilum vanderplanki]
MYNCLSLFIFFISLHFLTSGKVIIEEVIGIPNKQWSNVSFECYNKPNGDLILNVECNTTTEADNFTVYYTINYAKDEKDKNYENLFRKGSINFCKLFSGYQSGFIAKSIMYGFREHADFELKCPVKKGSYHVKDYIVTTKFVPSAILNMNHSKVILKNAVTISEPNYANFSAQIIQSENGESLLNENIQFYYNVSKITLFFTFAIGKDKNDQNYERIIIRTSVNACKMIQGALGDFVTKTIMHTLKNHVDFELKCPFKKTATLIIERILGTSDPKYSNFSSKIFKNENNETTLDITINFAYDIEKILIAFSFSIPKDSNDKNFERILMKSTINACKMLQGIMGDFFVKMIMENLAKHAKFELKCPFPKGIYVVSNFTLSNNFVPSYLLINDLKFMVVSKLTGKVANHKGFMHLFTAKTYGTILKKLSISSLTDMAKISNINASIPILS